MNFLFDNNLSPALAKALNELSVAEPHEVIHLRDRFPPNTPDHVWIEELGKEGGWSIVSQDRLVRASLEKEALRRSRQTAFILQRGWAGLKHWEKSWHLVRWWPSIVEMSERVEGGAFEVPVRFSGKGRLRPIQF